MRLEPESSSLVLSCCFDWLIQKQRTMPLDADACVFDELYSNVNAAGVGFCDEGTRVAAEGEFSMMAGGVKCALGCKEHK